MASAEHEIVIKLRIDVEDQPAPNPATVDRKLYNALGNALDCTAADEKFFRQLAESRASVVDSLAERNKALSAALTSIVSWCSNRNVSGENLRISVHYLAKAALDG